MLLVCLALVQVGILVRDQLVLVEAARAGAREAAVIAEEAEVRGAVEAAAANLDPGRIAVEVRREAGRGTPVTVQLSYDAPVVVPFVAWLFPDAITLTASATMRQEFG